MRCGPELVLARRSMQLISGILASRATMLAPILAATPNDVRTNHLRILGLARVLACSPRLTARGRCFWGGDGGRWASITFVSGGFGVVPANGPAANESRRPLSKAPCLE